MAAILGEIAGGISGAVGSIGGDIISNSGSIFSGLGSGVESALGGVGTVFSDILGTGSNSSSNSDLEFYLLLAGAGFLLYEFFNSGGARAALSLSPEGRIASFL